MAVRPGDLLCREFEMAERFVQGRADLGNRAGDPLAVGVAVSEHEMDVPAGERAGGLRVIDVAAVDEEFGAALIQ
jgi:hypothetical protein